MVKVKICGITNAEDALAACGYGADLVGFVFVENTPRFVSKEKVLEILQEVSKKFDAGVSKVGLFLDADIKDVADIAAFCGFDHIQLHGNETPEYCRDLKEAFTEICGCDIKIIKTFKVKEDGSFSEEDKFSAYSDADYFLFDTYSKERPGGTGLSFDPDMISKNTEKIQKPFFIAGGLTPDNVGDVIVKAKPYGIDVSSGVEASVGKKDKELLKEFISNAKKI